MPRGTSSIGGSSLNQWPARETIIDETKLECGPSKESDQHWLLFTLIEVFELSEMMEVT